VNRPSKDAYHMHLAFVAATRATCSRLKVGCAIMSAKGHVLSTGYNGSPAGMPHCFEVGHQLHKGSCVRTIHAEQNAIGHAARRGVALEGSTAYVTNHPCIMCAKLLVSAGIVRVVYADGYRADADNEASAASGIVFVQYAGPRPWELS
jgi:dCMP deaminase